MGELTGLSSMTWSFAQPLDSTFAGVLAEQTGSLRTVFEMTAVTMLASLLIVLTVKPPMGAEESPAAAQTVESKGR